VGVAVADAIGEVAAEAAGVLSVDTTFFFRFRGGRFFTSGEARTGTSW